MKGFINLLKKGTKKKPNNNSITALYAYKYHGQWVFDDATTGLVKEAFVAGADTLLDELTGNAEAARILFSSKPFPGAISLLMLDTHPSGTTYYCGKYHHPVWLCPALYLYLNPAPSEIYVSAKAA